jgi:histone H3/H4
VASGEGAQEARRRVRACWFRAPPELIDEVRRYWRGPLSPLIRQLLEEWLEERRKEQLLLGLPENLRRRLVERAGGERKASELALKLLEGALEELEEEEEAQEALAAAEAEGVEEEG